MVINIDGYDFDNKSLQNKNNETRRIYYFIVKKFIVLYSEDERLSYQKDEQVPNCD